MTEDVDLFCEEKIGIVSNNLHYKASGSFCNMGYSCQSLHVDQECRKWFNRIIIIQKEHNLEVIVLEVIITV